MKAWIALVAALALAVAASIGGCTKQPTFEEAEQLYKKGDYAAAAAAYAPYADQGDYRAQVYLGRHYLQKENLDLRKAANYFMKAADQGDTDAMYFLGMAYLKGDGVPQNADMGEQFLQKASRGNSTKAIMRLCLINEAKAQKTLLRSDIAVAMQWCEKAYQNGNLGGATYMQVLYGVGPTNDYQKGVAWYAASKLAANQSIDREFDMITSDQRMYVKAQAYALYSEFGKSKPPVTYLDSLFQKP
jgi:TPR repeat protein